jgi:acyl-CoA synthetase (AMP-forming)/AMP-acid ligase II
MLYERWRQIARERRTETALHDFALGKHWTFAELAAATEHDSVPAPVVFPQGREFIFTLLRAWRSGQVVCPLESGQAPPGFTLPPPECVHLKTTSATTGAPKLVAFRAEQLAADADNIVATMGLRPDWPNLGVISLAHSYGFSNLVLPLLLHGIPLILTDAALPETVLRAASQAEAITLPAVPALWSAWHSAGSIPKNIRLAISAGAPLSLALEQAVFTTHGLKIHNFYGSSECGGIAYDSTGKPRDDASCAGAPMKNVELSVDGNGCLRVRGRAVGETYWPEPDPKLKDGCFRASDMVELSGGLVYLRGRAGDQINIAGRKVFPELIEKTLLTHPLVRECLVFGAPSGDAERGETIVAYVAADPAVGGEVLKQFLLSRLPSWQIPRKWRFVEALQANDRGKLSRAEWRRKFLEEEK